MSGPPPSRPVGLLAELTHRCPLGCPYCSNPLDLDQRHTELGTASWKRVFAEAAAIGILHVHVSGGEPAARRDLGELVAHCAELGLYTNLITSGIGLTQAAVRGLADRGLDHVQLSFQDSEPASADRIAGYEGAFARKLEVASWITDAGMPLTVNAVIHRANVGRVGAMVELAIRLGARRVEIAHTQYYGWADKNRALLMPSRAEVDTATEQVERARTAHAGAIAIDYVAPDYHAQFPKPCMQGWARRTMNVTPSGKVLPCHAAEVIPDLEFWNIADHSLAEIWNHSPAFNAFRGEAWMQEPCRSCARRAIDFGGCRCQAFMLTGDAREADPVCHLSPRHGVVTQIIEETQRDGRAPSAYIYRRMQPVTMRDNAGSRERSASDSRSGG
jgi:pyrroloquinoline quinone biosynthesis protein E